MAERQGRQKMAEEFVSWTVGQTGPCWRLGGSPGICFCIYLGLAEGQGARWGSVQISMKTGCLQILENRWHLLGYKPWQGGPARLLADMPMAAALGPARYTGL